MKSGEMLGARSRPANIERSFGSTRDRCNRNAADHLKSMANEEYRAVLNQVKSDETRRQLHHGLKWRQANLLHRWSFNPINERGRDP